MICMRIGGDDGPRQAGMQNSPTLAGARAKQGVDLAGQALAPISISMGWIVGFVRPS